jgi:hypothetical protein
MTEKTYEMLWDCRYCGQKKLLGLSHRHCPSCGGPQDVAARYFPPDDERVAVEDHVYTGVDLECPACREACSVRVKFCPHCGSPLEGAAGVARREDIVHAEGRAFTGQSAGAVRAEQAAARAAAASGGAGQAAAARRRKRWPRVALAVLLASVAVGLVLFFWKRDVGLAVRGHHWVREIGIEQNKEVRESAWCDSVPARGTVIEQLQRKRSSKQVPDGEDCQVRKVDRGDGTYTEQRECTPKYRDEAVLDAYCRYRIHRWLPARSARAEGGLETPPAWPAVVLQQTGQCAGCEREGSRSESYLVMFADDRSGEEARCAFDESRWRQFAPGSRWIAGKRLTGGLACDDLRPVP